MKNSKVIHIGKKVIYIAGYYSHSDEIHKSHIEKALKNYKKDLSETENVYAKKLITFIDDLLDDIGAGRNLQIDDIFEDDYISYYYNTSKQIKYYNSLLDTETYKKILENTEDNNVLLETIYKNFLKNFKKLDMILISDALLIFTLFERQSPKRFLEQLYKFRYIYNFSAKSVKLIKKMLYRYEYFLQKVYKRGKSNISKKNIHYKYIKASKNKNDELDIKFALKDASKEKLRCGYPLYEYKRILRGMK